MYTRKCPRCKRLISHTHKHNRDVADKTQRLCKRCGYETRNQNGKNNPFYGKTHSLEARKKISLGDKSYSKDPAFTQKMSAITTGSKNPMYGRCNYQVWIEKYGKERADQLDKDFRKKQSILNSGENNNMYGKPSPHGAGNGWSGWYKGWYFRSLKELSYLINVIEKNKWKWVSAETNDLKIPYTDWKGNRRTYRADFLVEGKYLIEVKPTKLKSSVSVQTKSTAAKKFCKSRGLEYKIEDVETLSNDILKYMYLRKEIRFMKLYDKLFKQRYLNE